MSFLNDLSRGANTLIETLTNSVSVPKSVIIELKGEYPLFSFNRNLQNFWQPKQDSLTGLRKKLKKLATTSVENIVLVNRDFQGGLADIFTMRQILDEYRQNGKKISLYNESVDNRMLYLAASVDEFAVPETSSYWNANGMAARINFLKNTLDKIGIETEIERRSEYKSAGERFTETDFSPALRESLADVLGDIFNHWAEVVGKKRGFSAEQVKKLIDKAPFLMKTAHEEGLIDRLAFEDELTLGAKKIRTMSMPEFDFGNQGVAVVSLEGAIVDGDSRNLPPFPMIGGRQAGGTTVVRALRAAAQEKSVKAIVFHVDSGGGSAMASEMIWREIERIKKVKPVVAVMGNVAASGGYYVLCSANKIFAAPTTITGSIGVIFNKFNMSKLWEKLGFSPKTIKFSANADFLSSDRASTKEEKEKLGEIVDHIYTTFKQRIADGRKKTMMEVEEFAKGRIWSGKKALEIGLIDAIGTPFDAIQAAKEMAGLSSDAPVWNFTTPTKYVAPTDISAMTRLIKEVSMPKILVKMPFDLEIL